MAVSVYENYENFKKKWCGVPDEGNGYLPVELFPLFEGGESVSLFESYFSNQPPLENFRSRVKGQEGYFYYVFGNEATSDNRLVFVEDFTMDETSFYAIAIAHTKEGFGALRQYLISGEVI